MIVYLHGFLSSPQSSKAQSLFQYCNARRIHCIVPELPLAPEEARGDIESIITASGQSVTLVGSSLGGFYATYFCEKYQHVKAILINPAVAVDEKLAVFADTEVENYHTQQKLFFSADYIRQLHEMRVEKINRTESYWLLVQQGDEVLDYQEAVDYYAGCRQTVISGGDHGFVGFEDYLADIIEWSALTE